MRLIGLSYDAPLPLSVGWLPLDERTTVIMGPNGSGKSTLLRHLAETLPGADGSQPEPILVDPTVLGGEAAATLIFAEVTPDELADLLSASPLGDRALEWVLTGWPMQSAVKLGEQVKTALHRLGGQGRLLDALESSRTVAFEPSGEAGRHRAYWCLEPRDAMTVQRAAITGDVGRDPGIAAHGALLSREWQHLLLQAAPMLAAPLPATDPPLSAQRLPAGFDLVRKRLRDAIMDLVEFERYAREDWELGFAVEAPPRGARRDRGAWLEDSRADRVRISPVASGCCGLVARLAEESLSPFLRESYGLHVTLSAIDQWGADGPLLQLWLRSLDGKRAFAPESAADGHRLWLELAFHEAAALFEAALLRMQAYLEAAFDELEDRDDETTAEQGNPPGPQEVESYQRYGAMVGQLQLVEEDSAAGRAALDQIRALRRDTGGLYLIDEPERHLHPVIERKAMSWLKDLASRTGAQVIIATHSPHLIRAKGASFLRMQRDPDSGDEALYRPEPLAVESLEALDEFADELGFDRGELLTSVEVILFVEGVSDQTLLQALFGAELHHAGVIVVPIHGASRASRKGLVDSELVMRFTTAKLALLLDNVAEKTCRRIRDDAMERRRLAKEGSTEEQAMAQTMDAAYRLERDLRPIPLPCHDAFDLLDEGILTERYPSFPGHAVARERHPKRWKEGYDRAYGIVVGPPLFLDVAEEMAKRGDKPPTLQQVVSSVTELAAGSGGRAPFGSISS